MKHREPPSTEQADAIGAVVRELVESALRDLGHTPGPEFLLRIEKLAANISLWGSRMNLTAHPEDPDEIAFHVLDSLMPLIIASGANPGMLQDLFSEDKKILDLGSGAGFPGLVLAAASRARFTLIESRRKRASFLAVALADMGMKNVAVDPSRAEPRLLRPEFDLVTARALGNAAEFYGLAGAGLKAGGVAMLYANPSQRLSLDSAREAGLTSYTRVAYAVTRRDGRVSRVLALWRRS